MVTRYLPNRRIWLRQVLLPLAIAGLCLLLAFFAETLLVRIVGIITSVLFLFPAWKDYRILRRTYVEVSAKGLTSAIGGGEPITALWNRVLAAWRETPPSGRAVGYLGLRKSVLVVPLYWFDAQALWQQVEAHAPAEALAPDAYQRLPSYAVEAETPAELEREPEGD